MAGGRPKSIFDMPPDAAHEARLDADAEADYEAGRVVPHERVRDWLAKLAKGQESPATRGMTCACRLDHNGTAGIWRAHDYICDFNPRAAQQMAAPSSRQVIV